MTLREATFTGNDSGGECGVAVASRFTMPDAKAGGTGNSHRAVRSNAPFWYSFEYGAAHFTVISTEHDVRKGSPQRQVPAHCALSMVSHALLPDQERCLLAIS